MWLWLTEVRPGNIGDTSTALTVQLQRNQQLILSPLHLFSNLLCKNLARKSLESLWTKLDWLYISKIDLVRSYCLGEEDTLELSFEGPLSC